MTNWASFEPLIRLELDRFLKGTDPRHQFQRDLARDKGLLPVLIDWTAFVGLAPDGQLFWVEYDPPHNTTKYTGDEHLPLALMTQEYPSLVAAGPQRTAESKECKSCGGTGIVVIEGKVLSPTIVCRCGGLGWVPPDVA